MDNQTIQGIADTHPAGFSVGNDFGPFFQISRYIEVGVHDSSTGFYHRYPGIVPYKVYQSLAAPWNNKIPIAHRIKQFLGGLTLSRQEGDNMRVDAILLQHLMNDLLYSQIGGMGVAAAF